MYNKHNPNERSGLMTQFGKKLSSVNVRRSVQFLPNTKLLGTRKEIERYTYMLQRL